MTPIVLTENGEDEEEEDGAASTFSSAEASVPGGAVVATARPDGPSESVGIAPSEASSSPAEGAENNPGSKKGPSAAGGGGPAAADARADKPVVADRGGTREREARFGGSAGIDAPPANTGTEGTIRTDKTTTVVGDSLSLAQTEVTMANHDAAKTLSANQGARRETTVQVAKAAASPPRGSLAAGGARLASSGQRVPRATVKPPAAEQLFMEDTQVYLGCAACGVKYLVEAVDPEASKSTQGELRKAVAPHGCHLPCCGV